MVVHEDYGLMSVCDGRSWLNSNILSLHYHYRKTELRKCSAIDSHLLKIIPDMSTVCFLKMLIILVGPVMLLFPVKFTLDFKSRVDLSLCILPCLCVTSFRVTSGATLTQRQAKEVSACHRMCFSTWSLIFLYGVI